MASHDSPNPAPKPKQIELWISALALTIAFLTFAIGAYDRFEQRAFLRKQSEPVLSYDFRMSGELGFDLYLYNEGPGIAILRYYVAYVDGKTVNDWDTFVNSSGLRPRFTFSNPYPGKIFSPLQRMADGHFLLRIPPSEEYREFGRYFATRTSLEYCYCSIFDECWIVKVGEARSPVQECPDRRAENIRTPSRFWR